MEECMRLVTQLSAKAYYFLLSILVYCNLSTAFGAGFQISEQSGTGLGRAFAGFGVIGDDLSMAFYNPAGLTQQEGSQIQASGYVIDGKSKFTAEDGASNLIFGGGAIVIQNTEKNDDGSHTSLVPNLYFTMDLTERLKYGFAISAPFGLVTDYDRDWIGRYQAKESKLITVNINPSLAFKFHESFSVGMGFVAEYADATLSQALSNGPTTKDGFTEAKGDDWGYGWNIGFMYHPNDNFRAAVGYRSKINHVLRGDNKITGVPALGGKLKASASARVRLPETIHSGIYYKFAPKLGASVGLRWTRWSRLDEIVIKTNSPFVPDSRLQLAWENTISANIGIDYFHSNKWTFRVGFMYDESPTQDEFRTPRIPDEDRKWVAVGASYKANNNLNIDLGFTHIFVDDAEINNTTTIAGGAGTSTLVGEFENPEFNILSMQAVYKF